ncbi:MAG: phosphodiester glycosidase family protein [Leptolyngbya sp. SIO4C1]|nr:phosphodiester glycosidase family protein [Leptolyngbya sp. SIO4C1]
MLIPVFKGAIAALLALPLAGYAWLHFQRPAFVNKAETLFTGVIYRRYVSAVPRPYVMHVISIDLSLSTVKAFVTAGSPGAGESEITAATTSEFLAQSGLQIAVNASYFYPFLEDTPWNYFPHSGDGVNALGIAISEGQRYSSAQTDWPALCFSEQKAQIATAGDCPPETVQAVAGRQVLVTEGLANPRLAQSKPYACVAVALDRTGQQLQLVVIDGKQPLYSEGVTKAELAEILVELGAVSAIALDGGGSTTLVAETAAGPQLLNAPIHTKLPMRERAVANHLGFSAAPR